MVDEALFIKGSSAFISSSLKGSEKTGLLLLLLQLYVSIAAAMRDRSTQKIRYRERKRTEK